MEDIKVKNRKSPQMYI